MMSASGWNYSAAAFAVCGASYAIAAKREYEKSDRTQAVGYTALAALSISASTLCIYYAWSE